MIVLDLLLALAVIVAATRLVGCLFQRVDQPAVIGELVGGILLGPSLLGWVAPDVYAAILPPAVMPLLRLHAQAGVIFFMFLVGLELDGRMIRQSSRATFFISHASIVLPFALGYGLAYVLYPRLAPPSVGFMPFALFIGVSMAVTAFPVLARILRERGIHRTRMGSMALACAAVNDVTAWCLLALVVAISRFGNWEAAITHLAEVVASQLNHYAIFAAFLLGAMMPARVRMGAALHDRLARSVSLLFLPVFFAFSGIRTEVGLISGAANWGLCAAIVAVACTGKFGGSVAAARLTGIGWRDAAALGVLMNTRGLVELVVLNIGLDLGVISPTLFTMLVIMALVTTFMTSPMLRLLLRKTPWTVGEVSEVRLKADPAASLS
jgi:Kef-type K+ transport system membrane component KefB